MPADGKALTDTPRVSVKPARKTREPTFTQPPQPEQTTPEKGGADHLKPGITTRFIDARRRARARWQRAPQDCRYGLSVSGQRALSAMAADHRSALPRIPGIPWWGAVLLAATAAAVGFAYDAGSGDKTLSAAFAVCYAAGCIVAVLAVRQSGLFSAAVQPPLILFIAVPTAYFVFHGSKIMGIKDTLINCGYPLIERFPLMFLTSAAVLLVAMGRWYLAMSARRSASRDAETASPDTAEADSPLAAADTGAATGSSRRSRKHSIERPARAATSVADEAPQRATRKPRSAAGGASAASRSRHARPPETELIEPVVPRPRRPRSGPPVEPPAEPRRRTRAADPGDPRTPRAPREARRNLPPVERRGAQEPEQYERPQRRERSDRYGRSEQPERPRRISDYEPHEPRGMNGSSGTHHPVSRVRYRGADEGESRTENRTTPRRTRNSDADPWQ